MQQFTEILIFIFLGIVLLWFGYKLFFKKRISTLGGVLRRGKNGSSSLAEGSPGDPQICPVCSAKLGAGELVSSAAFPSINGGKDRFMHIRGCLRCLRGERDRICPVCGKILGGNEILISRLFERRGRHPHVHVLGCSRCKGPPSGRG